MKRRPHLGSLALVTVLCMRAIAQDVPAAERLAALHRQCRELQSHRAQPNEGAQRSLLLQFLSLRKEIADGGSLASSRVTAEAYARIHEVGECLNLSTQDVVSDLRTGLEAVRRFPAPRHGEPDVIKRLCQAAFRLGDMSEATAACKALVDEWPAGGGQELKRIWLAIEAARHLINMCRRPDEAEQMLTAALANLRAIGEWSDSRRFVLLEDPDLWITRKERPGAASYADCLGHLLNLRGFARLEWGRLGDALADLQDAKAPLAAAGNRHRLVNVDHNLATVWLRLGKLDQADAAAGRALKEYEDPKLSDGLVDYNGIQAMRKVQAQVELRRPDPDLDRVRELLTYDGSRIWMTAGHQHTNADAIATWAEMLLALPEPWSVKEREDFESVLADAEQVPSLSAFPTLRARMFQIDAERWLRSRDAEQARSALKRAERHGVTTPDLRVRQHLLRGRMLAIGRDHAEALKAFAASAREVRVAVDAQRLWAISSGVGDFQRQYDAAVGEAVQTWKQWHEQDELAATAKDGVALLYDVIACFHGYAEVFDALLEDLWAGLDRAHASKFRDECRRLNSQIEAKQLARPVTPFFRIRNRMERDRLLEELRAKEIELLSAARDPNGQGQERTSSLAQVRDVLAEGELLLEFAKYDGGYVLIGSSRAESWCVTFVSTHEFEDALAGFETADSDAAFDAAAAIVSRTLLGNGLAERCAKATTILVSPESRFAWVPFAALPFPDPKVPGARWVDRAAFAYVASGAQLVAARNGPPGPSVDDVWETGKLLAFANPRYPGAGGTVHPEAKRCGGDLTQLTPLPGTAQEVLAVARLFATADEQGSLDHPQPEVLDDVIAGVRFSVHLGNKAHESILHHADKTNVRFLHLACHGAADPVAAELSFLALTLDQDRSDEGLLRVPEFGGLRGNYELVVLSACRSNAGPLRGRETPASLARAAQAVGGRRVLATLWPVGDAAARDLVVAFYRNWHDNKSAGAAQALRAAQRAAAASGRPAREWAAFTLWGEPR